MLFDSCWFNQFLFSAQWIHIFCWLTYHGWVKECWCCSTFQLIAFWSQYFTAFSLLNFPFYCIHIWSYLDYLYVIICFWAKTVLGTYKRLSSLYPLFYMFVFWERITTVFVPKPLGGASAPHAQAPRRQRCSRAGGWANDGHRRVRGWVNGIHSMPKFMEYDP